MNDLRRGDGGVRVWCGPCGCRSVKNSWGGLMTTSSKKLTTFFGLNIWGAKSPKPLICAAYAYK